MAKLSDPIGKARVSDRRRTHVDSTAAGAKIEGRPDHGNSLRTRLRGHGNKANFPRDGEG
jgi:hypothetical protein